MLKEQEETKREEIQINVKKIMAEIRETVRKNGPYEELPAFDQIPIPQKAETISAEQLRKRILEKTGDLAVPPVFSAGEGNGLKRLYKRIVSKLVRCATFPLSVRVTQTNAQLRECLELTCGVIERQQAQIDQLSRRMETVEKQIHG